MMDNRAMAWWSDEDGCYIAVHPDYPPTLSAFGDTTEEAFKELATVLEMADELAAEDEKMKDYSCGRGAASVEVREHGAFG